MSSIVGSIFSQQLAARLKEKGITASDLARMVSVSPTAVWNWQRGNTLPRPAALGSIAHALGVTSQHLMYGDVESQDETETVASVIEVAKVKISKLTGIPIENVKLRLEMSPD